MGVIALFRYEVRPGRMADFMAKLQKAASPEFDSPVMPSNVRLLRSFVPGPDTDGIVLMIEYPDAAAYGARTAWEQANPAWRDLFESRPDSPERLVGVELLSDS